MRLVRITEQDSERFKQAFALYESAFPYGERRDKDEQARVMKHADYHCNALMEGENFIGILWFWKVGESVFLEHFAVLPPLRNQGYGAKALAQLKQTGSLVFLEIEPPADELTKRRYGFYRRNGFMMNEHRHTQAKYHVRDGVLELKILSYPRPLTQGEYQAFYAYMKREIEISTKSIKE